MESTKEKSASQGFVATSIMGLGLALSLLAWVAAPLVSASHDLIYHWPGSVFNLFAAVITDILAVAAFLTPVLYSARRVGRWRTSLWAAIVLFAPSVALRNWSSIEGVRLWHPLTQGLFWGAFTVWLVILLSWRPSFIAISEDALNLAETMVFFMGLVGVVLLLELGGLGVWAQHLNTSASFQDPPPPPLRGTKPRIIWILFDELSFQQTFERRLSGLSLPAFDSLALQSTLFTHAVPNGSFTEQLLPSLITGEPVNRIQSTPDGHLLLGLANQRQFRPFNQFDTVFADARANGYRTAVAGWFNPYCRILPRVLDSCVWVLNERTPNGLLPQGSFLENAFQPFFLGAGAIGMLARMPALKQQISLEDSQEHLKDLLELTSATDKMLNDKSLDFVFLHLPIPHPNGIYNRSTGQFALSGSTYIDNLALADRMLAHIRSLLEQRGEWDDATVLVAGDHSWRTTQIWSADPAWSEEEQRASLGGKFDPRPAYIVKLPHQKTANTVDSPFLTTNTRKLIDRLLERKIQTADDLAKWAAGTH